MNNLSWEDFDECIISIYEQCKYKKFLGVYGFPRGGLCLAVALSHSLGIPLLKEPQNNILIVDDIYETGYTLNKIRHLEGTEIFVWISKIKPTWYKAFKYLRQEEWIIFPWENINTARSDRDLYYHSRKKNK